MTLISLKLSGHSSLSNLQNWGSLFLVFRNAGGTTYSKGGGNIWPES